MTKTIDCGTFNPTFSASLANPTPGLDTRIPVRGTATTRPTQPGRVLDCPVTNDCSNCGSQSLCATPENVKELELVGGMFKSRTTSLKQHLEEQQ